MKKFLAGVCLVCASLSVHAEAILMATSADNTQEWYGYAESFTRVSDAYSVMIGKRFPKSPNKDEERFFVAVSFDDCKRGFGSLYTRDRENQNWAVSSNISMSDQKTVGDAVAALICEAGKAMKKPKTKQQKS